MGIDEPQAVPDAWHRYFKKRGIEPKFRALHQRVEDHLALNTVIRALTGDGTSSKRVVKKLADELGITPAQFNTVRATLAGQKPVEPFSLPDRAAQLDKRERAVITSMINALLDARNKSADQPEMSPGAIDLHDSLAAGIAELEVDRTDDGGKQAR